MAVAAQMTPQQVVFDVAKALKIWGRKGKISLETLGPTRYEFGLLDEESRTRLLIEVNVGRTFTVDFRLSHIQGLPPAGYRLLGFGTLSEVTGITYDEDENPGCVRFTSSAGELLVRADRTFVIVAS